MLASRVPVYGTKEAGRGLWLRLKNVQTVQIYTESNSAILGWCFVEKSSDKTKTFGIHVTAKDNTERVQPITYDAKHGLTRKAAADEIHQLRSVTQFLAWIARHTQPDLSYRISKIQNTFENACVRDLRECNRIVEYATSASTRGIISPDLFGDDAVVVTISDASFCQEQEQFDGVTQNFILQQACITALAPGNALNAEKMLIHPLSWSSTRIRRVCRSTRMAEAHALSNAVERGFRTRATIFDMRGQLYIRQAEAASAAIRHVWFTDCESLFAHLILPNTKQVDNKRLAIDLSALKQLIWDNRDDCDGEVDGSKGNYSRWIDTSAMLSDCLTKAMTSGRLNEKLKTGIFDMRPTEESLAIKAKNWKWRASKKEQERLQDLDH